MIHRRLPAFTLIECLFAVVLLTLVVISVLQPVAAGHEEVSDSAHRMRAMQLAEALMERILSHPYQDPNNVMNPGPEPGETTVSQYNNMDDFDGYTQSIGSEKDAAGNAYPTAYQSFSRSVTCSYGKMHVSTYGSPINGLTITVTVTDSKGNTWQLTRFVAEPPS